MKEQKIYRWALILLLLIAAFLYFFKLGKDGLFTDEYLSLYSAQQSIHDIIFNHRSPENPNTMPPLYVLILHFWLKIFGVTEVAQRSFSALLGIASVYILYKLTKLLFDSRTALISAFFGSFSFTWFYIFRQNRAYSLFIFLTLVSFYLFFLFLVGKENKPFLFLLFIINTLLLYTHYLAFLVIFMELLIFYFEKSRIKEKLGVFLRTFAFSFIFFTPWIPNLVFDLHREPVLIDRLYSKDAISYLFDMLRIFFSDFHFEWFPLLAIVYLPFLIKGFIDLKKSRLLGKSRFWLYLLLILFLPFIFIYIFLSSDRVRYFAPFMFPLLILLAIGISNLRAGDLKGRVLILSLWVLIFSNNIIDFSDFFAYNLSEEWKEAAVLIKKLSEYKGKEDVFIFQTRYNPPVFSYYHWGPKAADLFVDNIATGQLYDDDASKAKIREKIFVIKDMKGQKFFSQLDSFPESNWIWIFRYHDRIFADEFRIENENRYVFHQVKLNNEHPSIDLYLLRKIRQ